ncbi:N-6 DNA methylase [Lactococcus allomyrinae]|uniref:Helicase C-terminal domain-containing protein n=1 Tax=Lactococcus allomyrinae TaxID=2419773 RepID=A0A387BFT9_9LACT|nr:N-6 DNA methylase [Lactococcus allomyrinae]AYG01134.1 hypothetical protein D7I46_08525 [Lactococcus allomyrinae]
MLKTTVTPNEYRAMRESSLTAYYTDPALIREMFIQLERQGFKGGRILDPAMGTGNFFSSLPAHLRQNSELYGIELDTITGSIAKFLHPNAHIKIQGFETIDFESESFDVIVGNVPFANFTITDAHYNKPYLIHDYFFKKSSELVRQGGLVSFITSTGTMNKPNASLRQELHQEMGLVSAVRLPNSAFKAIAGTKVATDILTLQKGQSDELDDWIETVPAEEAHDVDVNQFFSSSRSPYVLGEYEVQNHFRKTLTVVPEPTQPLLSSLHAAYEQQASFMPGVPAFFEGTQEERNNIIEKSILIKKDFSLSLPDEVKDLAPQTHKIVGDKVYFHDPDDGIIEKNQEWYDDGFQQAVDENDRLIFDQKGQPKLVNFRGKFDKKTLPRLKGMTAISEKVQAIIDYQLNQPPVQGEDSTFKRLLSDLNRVYDNFIQDKNLALKGGNCLNSSKNAKLFADDINFYRLLSIENEVRDEDGHTTYEKGDFFFKKTITPSKGLPVIENAVDALNVSLNLYGQVNLDFMSEQLSVTSEEILSELQGQLFLNPISMQYEPASIYLSGNIKKKISQLRPFLNSNDSRFSSNQQALEAILPEPLSIHQIDFWIGTRWIPLSIYQTFLKEKLNNGYGLGMSLDYNTYRATYNIENATAINRVAEWQLSSLYRSLVISGKTANYNPIHLFENLLNLKNTKIKNTIKHEDGTTETFVDAELTIVAREKQILLQQAFKDFVHQTPEISQIMEQVYNDRFNSIVPRTYDGSHLTFSSLTDTITLRAHQKNAVARVIQEKRGLFAHVVGSGKTLSMIASGMKLKELGTINKPCYVVPKAVLNQFAADILRAYPDKNIIVPTYRDFEVSHRKRFVTKIQTGDYDAVILSNEQFGKIGLTKEREEAVIKAEIDEIVEARAAAKAKEGGRSTVKQLIQLEKSAKKRLLKLQTEKDDSPITFEATGIDFLFLDEAHHFKNLSYMTNITDVKGISTTASQRASSLLAKVRYLQEIHDGGGVVFATGTPVSNSMAELYTMMKYLMPRELRDYGISNFDEWASAFGEIETKNEVDQTGQKWKPVSRFSRFNNLPELMNLFSTVADIQTAEMLNLPTPEIANDGKPFVHASELTEAQAAFMKQLIWRSEHMPSDPSIDNFLKLTTEARLMATDMRLIDPDFYNPSDSLKGQQVAEEVHKIWEENKEKHSTQLIFSDIGTPKSERKDKNVSLNAEDLDYKFSVYADIRRRLMELGIPQKEIAFIHDYPTDKKKAELFEKVREGKIRVLFASTQKGGTGVNIQDRLIAVHHVDVPWRPSDIEQRNGRIVRQGNLNPEVQIHHYVTKGSFDTFMWQVQEKKLTYITQILSGKNVGRSMEDLNELVLTASEIKAIATNNPKIREKMDLENQLTSLSILRSTFYADKQADKREAERLEAHLPLMRQYATNALFDGKIAASYQTSSPEHFQLTLIDSTFTEKKKAGEFIASQAYHATEQKNLGQYAGFELLIKPNLAAELTAEPMAYLVGKNTYSTPVNLSSGIGTLTRLDNLVKNVIKGKADNQQEKIENIEKSIVTLKSKLNEPFEKEAEYQRLSQKLEAVNTAIELENVHKNTVEKEIKTPSQKIKTIDEEMEF